MGNKIYDGLKFIALIVLPATSSLYFGLGQLWDFPEVEKVVGSIAVVDAVLGTVLNRSSNKVVVAEILVGQDEDGAAEIRKFAQVQDDPIIFEDKKNLLVRVKREE